MRTNQDYKNAALNRLRGNWAPGVIATLVYILIVGIIAGGSQSPTLFARRLVTDASATWAMFGITGLGLVATIFVVYPMQVGYQNANRLLFERRDYNVTSNMIQLATSNYLHKVGGMFMMFLKVFLWTLLFIIPGIIMSFAYAMTPYILEDHPEIGIWEASTRSREMMKGHKFDLFYLDLSFIGWFLLGILTFGIGLLWLSPYIQGATSAFYNDLKAGLGEDAVTE